MLISTSNVHSPMAWIPSSQEPISSVFLSKIENFGFYLLDAEQRLREQTIGPVTIDQECGDPYKEQVVFYINGVYELRERNTASFASLAENIRNPNELMAFLVALAPLASRPSKKTVAALHDPETGRLRVAWNGLCRGLPLRAEFLEKIPGHPRGTQLWCSERMVLLEELDENARLDLFWDTSDPHPVPRNALIQAARELTERVRHKILAEFPESQNDLYSTQYSCLPCAELIAPEINNGNRRSTVNNIYTRYVPSYDNELGKNPNRQTHASEAVLAEADRSMILLDYRAPYECPHGCACG